MLTTRLILFCFALLVVSSVAAVPGSFQQTSHSLSGSIKKRGSKEHNDPPCPPEGKTPKTGIVEDDGADVGVLPYTEEIIKDGNEEHEAPKRRFVDKDDNTTNTESLSKRKNGQLRKLYNEAEIKVPTNQGARYHFRWQGAKHIESQTVATNDLSGCTVVVVASPFAVIMVHVWERRDDSHDSQGWLIEPNGDTQKSMDNILVTKGKQLINQLLEPLGGTTQNGFNHYFPPDKTTVNVVAPAANPEYDGNINPFVAEGPFSNPWYTYGADAKAKNPGRYIYQRAAIQLLEAATAKFIPGREGQASMSPYKRRYSNDKNHGTDDTEFIILKPQVMSNQEVRLFMLFDDDAGLPICKLA